MEIRDEKLCEKENRRKWDSNPRPTSQTHNQSQTFYPLGHGDN